MLLPCHADRLTKASETGHAPLRNLDGEIVGAFTIHTDLTEIYAQKDHIAELVNNTYRSAGTAREISRTQSEAFETC